MIIEIAVGIVLGVILLFLLPFIIIILGYLLLILIPILLVVLLVNYFPVISDWILSINSDDWEWEIVIFVAPLVIILFLASTEFWYKKK
jgi:hypothetical protein